MGYGNFVSESNFRSCCSSTEEYNGIQKIQLITNEEK